MMSHINVFLERNGDFMGLFTIVGNPNAIFDTKFLLVSGIPGWGENVHVIKAELLEDRITFHKSTFQDIGSISLMYNQITGTEFFTETELKTKSTSVVGRSLIGGALFGSTGAIVGGMSAVNDKTEEKNKHYYMISYNNSQNEPAAILLNTDCAPFKVYKFDKLLLERIPKKETTPKEAPEFL